MKKILLMCNLFFIVLISSFSVNKSQNYYPNSHVNLLSNEDESCQEYDYIVNITTQQNLISGSGIVVYKENGYIYAATSATYYNDTYNYEIVLNDYRRVKASVVGIASEDEILLLRAAIGTNSFCLPRFYKTEFIKKLQKVKLLGKYHYSNIKTSTYINNVGVMRNNEDEGFKRYFYTFISDDVEDYFIGSAMFDSSSQLMGLVVSRDADSRNGLRVVDIDKLIAICEDLISFGSYQKKYLKADLVNVNSLTDHDKYLYSVEGLNDGVLVTSIHYLNYLFGGLNQGMVILSVNGNNINSIYELDNILLNYRIGDIIYVKIRAITGNYRTIKIKL